MNVSDFFSVFLIAIGLSADCFAVALSTGIANKNHSWWQIIRVSLFFGLFQGSMPVLGWLAGKTIVEYIADYDHWVAFGLLVIVSCRMFWEAFRPEKEEVKAIDVTKGLILLTLSLATSIDALAVGLSFAFLEIDIATAGMTIGIVAFVITAIGFILGSKVSSLIGRRAIIIGGIILLVIALRILLSHLF